MLCTLGYLFGTRQSMRKAPAGTETLEVGR
jgi:hypothetical protein